ncbi:hypothetical protein SDC9_158773 [bioreactor metagenome]|uniref:Uncharacterized protein n=1 Tax=bioreactor metagenome TaxID=1076179 RepID=A0A645FC28_9ZZZZ
MQLRSRPAGVDLSPGVGLSVVCHHGDGAQTCVRTVHCHECRAGNRIGIGEQPDIGRSHSIREFHAGIGVYLYSLAICSNGGNPRLAFFDFKVGQQLNLAIKNEISCTSFAECVRTEIPIHGCSCVGMNRQVQRRTFDQGHIGFSEESACKLDGGVGLDSDVGVLTAELYKSKQPG